MFWMSTLIATSKCTATAAAPIAAAVCASAPLQSAQTTLAPSRANSSAICLPMPEPAPVTIATLSCRRAMCFSSSFDLWPQPYSGRGVDGRADRDHRDVRADRHADDQHDGVGNVAWRHRPVLADVRDRKRCGG